MFPRVPFAFIANLTDVDPVTQNAVDGILGKPAVASYRSVERDGFSPVSLLVYDLTGLDDGAGFYKGL